MFNFLHKKIEEPSIIESSQIINGKKVFIRIYMQHLFSRIKTLNYDFKQTIKSKKDLKPVLAFIKNKVYDMSVKLIFGAFFRIIKNEILNIESDEFRIYIKLDYLESGGGEFVYEISTETDAFFKIHTDYLIHEVFQEYSKIDNSIIKIIDSYTKDMTRFSRGLRIATIATLDANFYEVVVHEFVHYLDQKKLREKGIIGNRIESKLKRYHVPSVNLVILISRFRSEGVARFFEYRKKDFLFYNAVGVEVVRESIARYEGGRNLNFIIADLSRLIYEIGLYMCYFIGLAYLFKSDREYFDSMRICFDKNCSDFRFFAEGIGNILDSRREYGVGDIWLQNFPEEFIIKMRDTILKWSHIKFIQEYQKACEILEIPQKHITITLPDYNRIKKKAYDRWVENVRMHGFI